MSEPIELPQSTRDYLVKTLRDLPGNIFQDIANMRMVSWITQGPGMRKHLIGLVEANNTTDSLLGLIFRESLSCSTVVRTLSCSALQALSESCLVQAWANCEPTECDWGTVTLKLLGNSIEDKSPRYGFAHWDPGFADIYLTLRIENTVLVVEEFTCFKDKSGRLDVHSAYSLRKQ
jgi:hypothetical protein